MYLREKIHKL